MTDESQLALIPSNNAIMANYLNDTEALTERAARANLETWLSTSGIDASVYTTPQLRSIVKLEQLKRVGDLNLQAILLHGKVIQQIENEGLWAIHPNQYGSMQEAAMDHGLSVSEYSDIKNLYNVIFPYITNTLNLSLPQVWETVGKSNFRMMVPVLVRLITGNRSQSRNVEETVERLQNEVTATFQAAGQEADATEVQVEVITQLLERGQLPNRELRQHLRPDRTPSFPAYITSVTIRGEEKKVIVSVVDADQLTVFNRRLGTYIDSLTVQASTLAHSEIFRAIRGETEHE
jgi:hypothetical protein